MQTHYAEIIAENDKYKLVNESLDGDWYWLDWYRRLTVIDKNTPEIYENDGISSKYTYFQYSVDSHIPEGNELGLENSRLIKAIDDLFPMPITVIVNEVSCKYSYDSPEGKEIKDFILENCNNKDILLLYDNTKYNSECNLYTNSSKILPEKSEILSSITKTVQDLLDKEKI